jgi:S-DNA-T family DNA segregation ATPase FtsK/SpoIIIE
MATARSTRKPRRAPAARAAGQRQPARRTAAPKAAGRTTRRKPANHGRELVAVFVIALAVFLGFVLYAGWHGGLAGHWLSAALFWLIGVGTYLTPALLLYAAYLVAGGKSARLPRPVAFGSAFLGLALLLAAAANTFSLFGGGRPAASYASAHLRHHGGAFGEILWSGVNLVGGHVGVTIVVLFLVVAGLLLVSGSSLGLWASRSRRGVKAAGRAARRQARVLDEHRRTAVQRLQTQSLDDMSEAATQQYGPGVSTHPIELIDGQRSVPEIFAAAAGASDSVSAIPRGADDGDDFSDDGPIVAVEEPVEDGVQLTIPTDASGGFVSSDETALAFAASEQRDWSLPDTSLLRPLGDGQGEAPDTIRAVSAHLVETLGNFGVPAQVINTVSGPRVTRYELQLAPGVKVNRVSALKDDIAYALAATDIRVQAPIPGKTAVGVEVPNQRPNFVGLGDVYGVFPANATPLAVWIGKDITGKPVLADLAKMVHVLIAGTTGSGKSGCINCIVSSILLRATPDQVRMIMIDPKKVELSHFDGVPHLLTPVVTKPKEASYVLHNVVRQMDYRYELMARVGSSQTIHDLNKKLEARGEPKLPYIVIVIDELADLMMVAPAEVEDHIMRLGQLGRGAGIHLVVATQRPSVDVVTGMIKANIPSRIAFAVSSQTDSRVILDVGGAESLLGEGDMLFRPFGSNRLLRVQGAYMASAEMKLITEHWRRQATPQFQKEMLESPAASEPEGASGAGEDDLLADAITTVVATGAASVALLQRRLRVGYARAGRLIDIMEGMSIISGYDGSKARNVLVNETQLADILAGVRGGGRGPAADAVAAGQFAAADPPAAGE